MSEPGAGVIEFLTFRVPPDEQREWLALETHHWTRFLERQAGFVRKEVWASPDRPDELHAVIWWRSVELWKSIPAADLAAVSEAMGPHERAPECRTYHVVRG